MSDDHNPRAEAGDNNPPAPVKVFNDRLEAEHEDLRDSEMDLELDRAKLPHEVTSDEDVAKITAWVTRARALSRDVEGRRKTAKDPYLERERWIDGWFGKFRDKLLGTAKEIEQRSTAYLQAKRVREEAEARAKAEAAAAERRRQEAAAAEARAAEERAAAARRAAEEEAQAAVRRAAQAETAEREEAQRAANQAEADLRRANEAEAAASKTATEADAAHRTAAVAEQRAEKRVEQPAKLAKTGGGGGNATVKMVPSWRVTSWPALQQSLGPLGSFVDAKWLDGPLQRWANIAQGKPNERGDIPGVEWFETPETKTTATRPPHGHYLSERED